MVSNTQGIFQSYRIKILIQNKYIFIVEIRDFIWDRSHANDIFLRFFSNFFQSKGMPGAEL